MNFLLNKRLNFQILVLSFLNFYRVCNCLNKTEISTRVSGGNVIDKYDLGKYVVSIQLNLKTNDDSFFGWYHFCGGSIIGKDKILTAAHCLLRPSGRLFRPNEIVVVVGLRNRFVRDDKTRIMEVAKLRIHHAFGKTASPLYGDVGVITLKEAILFDSPRVAIVEFPRSAYRVRDQCTVIGWGRIFQMGPTADELGFADLTILRSIWCTNRYGFHFNAGMVCAANPNDWQKSACQGDSGGPLICRKQVTGIVSWGSRCGRTYYPGVYTDVYFFRRWILSGASLRSNYLVFVIFFIQFVLSLL